MNDWIDFFYFFMDGAVLLLSVLGVWFTAVIPGIDRWGRRFFLSYFTVLLLSSVSVLAEVGLRYYPVPMAVIYASLFLETLLLSFPLPMQTAYLLHCCGEDIRSSKLLHAILGLWTVFFVLVVFALFFSDFFYIVTPESQDIRGPFYPLLLAPVSLIVLFNFIGTLRRRPRLSRKAFISFVIAEVPMAATLVVNMFVDVVWLFDFGYVLSALAMYSFILSDQLEQDRRRQREIILKEQEIARQQWEIAHERANVMVLQMRPHFIYNTLMSIYSLCRLDPMKARQVTMDFTNYLRKNFNAVASGSLIPFSAEMEHTRAYLAVEQAQYNDMLAVEWDTQFTRFRLPPLTLQPIVENAVKHGMDPDSGALHISIQTRCTEGRVQIVVENTGPDFDPEGDSGPQITLKNIQLRLEMMCEGSMTIRPRDGGGTVVKLTFPIDAGQNMSS